MKPLVLTEKPFSQELQSKRLRLKLSRIGQAQALWQAIKKDRERGGLSWFQIQNLEHARDYLRKKSLKNPGPELNYFSFNKKDELIGSIHIHTINYLDHVLELGYWVCKQFEGYGFASEALKAVENEVKKLGFHRIEIRCQPRNVRSVQLAERNGYRHEGTLRQDTRVEGGFVDTAVYAKIIGTDESFELV